MKVLMKRWGCGVLVGLLLTASLVQAEPWKEDFDRLCGQTAVAEELTVPELDSLTADCDRVMRDIEKSDSVEKKVYLFRLKKCRNLYSYLAEVKKSQGEK